MPATRDGKIWRSQFYYEDWQGVRHAYNLMREYNKELKAKGYIVVAGKISTKFLAEKIYGMKVED